MSDLRYPNEILAPGGHITYAQLPTGGGTWANGGPLSITGGTVTLGAGLNVTGQINTVGAGGSSGDWTNTNSSINIVGTNDSFNPSFSNTSYNSVAPNISAAFLFGRARGTVSAPTAVLAGDTLGGFFAKGYQGAAFTGNVGKFAFVAGENFTGSAAGTKAVFELAPNGSTARREAFAVDGATPLADGDTVLLVIRRAGGVDQEVRIQWKDGSAILPGVKVLTLSA